MFRKVSSFPVSIAHYSFGSVLLVTQLFAIGVRQRQSEPA